MTCSVNSRADRVLPVSGIIDENGGPDVKTLPQIKITTATASCRSAASAHDDSVR